ncbi:MAG: DUF169 domain-containing protein [Candidatus Jordarchaeum sp.]|uniref:DUF169 domain-containing protein n=1 Tax=Candidatus Jordarchaeum sp. TaxID=2823881 RepID=UPI00404AA3CE
MDKWKELDDKLNRYLRLATFPIGVKLLEEEKELKNISRLKRPDKKIALCQIFSYSRYYGWTMGLTEEDNICPLAEIALGFVEPYDIFLEGYFFVGRYNETLEGAKKTSNMIPKMPYGKFGAIVSGALSRVEYDPDFVMIYGNTAQMLRVIQGSLWKEGGRIIISTFGDAVCADTISNVYLTGKIQIAMPCLGDRRFGLAMDSDLVASIPLEFIDSVLEGLEGTHKGGSRYPIPYQICTPEFFLEQQKQLEEARKGKKP